MNIPYYLKIAQVLLALVAAFFILYVGQNIIAPLVFAILVAILLNPVVAFFVRFRINRVVSIVLAILLMFIVLFAIFYFIGAQISTFRDALPELKVKFNDLLEQTLDWISQKFRIPHSKLDAWMEKKKTESLHDAGGRVGSTLVSISSMLVLVFLVPVYIFLFLFYKPLLLTFIGKVFKNDKDGTVAEVLTSTKTLIQSYLMGLMIEMVIVATLNSTALLIIGVDYAIVLGVIGAILNLIPYIGGIIAISLPMIMALLSGTPTSAIFVFLAYCLIQLIDNNFLVPMIVASKVKVNALVSIIVVLIGGALWGVAGMFFAIPVTAIVKVICDHVVELEPYGYLIGDDMPPPTEIFRFRKKVQRRNSPHEKK
jgi:predicted PurR-regulated permease PerM